MRNKRHIYFNQNTRRGFLGPRPPDAVNYRKIYAQEHPVMDSGDVLYGMFTLANGRITDSGQFIPGYGLPASSTAFESGNSIAYRMWQWARTLPRVTFLPAILMFFVAMIVGLFWQDAYTPLLLVSFGLAALAIPLAIIAIPFALIYIPITSRRRTRRAIANIRDQLISPQVVQQIVESHGCPHCGVLLTFNYQKYEAECPVHGHWPIAL